MTIDRIQKAALSLCIYDTSNGEAILEVADQPLGSRVWLSADGTQVVVLSANTLFDDALTLWDVKEGNPLKQFSVAPCGVSVIDCRNDLKQCAWLDAKGRLRLLDLEKGTIADMDGGAVTALCFHSQSRGFYVGTKSGALEFQPMP